MEAIPPPYPLAKAIAALNHPNIITVHSVEQADGVHFITMELVKGKTLAELLPRNGFPLDEFLEIAIPLADAVAAAHEQSIIHRDVKPGNVMVTDDGRVKVLDFGLAQTEAPLQTAPDSESPTALKTRAGVLLGTLHYMSPEQVEGKTLDARSDTFSLGIVFYEMLCGRRPFEGDTLPSTLSSVLKDDPPPLQPEIPRELWRIVRKCLVKDPERRYQSSKDVRLDLEELKHELDSGHLQPEAGVAPTASRWRAGLVGALLALTSGFVGYSLRPGTDVDPEIDAFRLTNPIQITSAVGAEDHPSWSPDGRTLVYESKQTGNWDIWVAQVGTGDAANRTVDHSGNDRYPSWSPDGNQIAFWSDRDGGSYFMMSALGGAPRRVATSVRVVGVFGAQRPMWSADGQRLAVLTTGDRSIIEIVSLQSGEIATVQLESSAFEPSWSHDERFFAFATVAPTAEVTQLWVVRAEDGKGFILTDGFSRSRGPSFSPDGRTLFYISNRGGSMDLWRQRLNEEGAPVGPANAVSSGLGIRSVANFSPDGSRIAYSRGRFRVANVWRVPLMQDRPATWSDATQLTFDQAFAEFVDVSPDGERLLVTSDRAGNPDLWILPSDGGSMTPLTTNPTPDWNARWSPDGTQIVFYAYRSGARELWVMPVEGGRARQLTTEGGTFPAWSPDGQEVAFIASQGVYIVPVAGGEARQVVDSAASFASWSPDGEWITYASLPGLWRVGTDRHWVSVLRYGTRRPRVGTSYQGADLALRRYSARDVGKTKLGPTFLQGEQTPLLQLPGG